MHQQRFRSNLLGLEESLGVKPVIYGQSAAVAAAAARGVRFTEAPNNITPAQARGLALAVADRPQDRSPSHARPTPHPRTPDYGTSMLQHQLQESRGALEAERTITSRLTAQLAEATADADARCNASVRAAIDAADARCNASVAHAASVARSEGAATLAAAWQRAEEAGTLDPDQIHLPGVYVHRVVQSQGYEKRIEKRTVSLGDDPALSLVQKLSPERLRIVKRAVRARPLR